jgi:hypothetical protein
MRDAISGTQCKSDAIRDGLILLAPPLHLRMQSNQWHSVAIRRNQTQSVAISGNQTDLRMRSRQAISGTQWQSDAIRRNQWQSVAIRRT